MKLNKDEVRWDNQWRRAACARPNPTLRNTAEAPSVSPVGGALRGTEEGDKIASLLQISLIVEGNDDVWGTWEGELVEQITRRWIALSLAPAGAAA
eukprot:2532218-Prymnesium_polylepis.1